jgi:Protein-L-isoaspartate(D-aspartate) O-methyltransferase (PCMT)
MAQARRRPRTPGAGVDQPIRSRSKAVFARLRNEMVEKAIVARGVRSELVFRAMRNVAREAFLPQHLREFAYDDSPLPIEEGQTVSQPYIVAFMTEALALEGGETVLKIGTGSAMRRRSSPKSAAMSTRSSVSASWPRRRPPPRPISAMPTCTFYMGTEPRAGRIMHLITASSSPLVARRSRIR